ncbi:MAG TPA: hypothetical protein VLI05_06055 [Candidatus Saccharimonadia bacterium]|nr:hypothetical protein [Candidatus Saccharimonadia bacterium]
MVGERFKRALIGIATTLVATITFATPLLLAPQAAHAADTAVTASEFFFKYLTYDNSNPNDPSATIQVSGGHLREPAILTFDSGGCANTSDPSCSATNPFTNTSATFTGQGTSATAKNAAGDACRINFSLKLNGAWDKGAVTISAAGGIIGIVGVGCELPLPRGQNQDVTGNVAIHEAQIVGGPSECPSGMHLNPDVGKCTSAPTGVNNDQCPTGATLVLGNGHNTGNYCVADPTGSTSADGTQNQVECQSDGGLSWLLCGALKVMTGAIDWIRDNIIIPFLKTTPLDLTPSSSNVALAVWSQFRDIANVFFILIFFLVIFGTALGFDNYSVKKVLPRLIAAAVLVQFSYLISAAIVDSGNVVGGGIARIMEPAINAGGAPTIDFTANGWSSWTALGAAALGIAAAGSAVIGISFGVIFGVLISMLVVFFMLVLRVVFVDALAVASPFAFVAWVLPNTEKYTNRWAKGMVVMAFIYPGFVFLVELSRFAGKISAIAATANPSVSAVQPLIGFASEAVPLFLVGGLISAGIAAVAGAEAGVRAVGNVLHGQFGAKSDFAARRAANRQYRGSMSATGQPLSQVGKGMQAVPVLGALNKAFGAKRAGFGWNPKNAQYNQMQQVATKGTADRASAQARKEFNRDNSQITAQDALDAQTRALKDKMLDERAAQAGLQSAVKDGPAIRDVTLDSSGIRDLSNALKEAVRTGDQGRAVAIMQRMSQSQGGIDALQKLRSGEDHIDAAGVLHRGANGVNGDGTASLLGGSDSRVVDQKWAAAWSKGTANAKSMDINKPPVSAFSDVSSEEIAGMSAQQAARAIDFYKRNAADPAIANEAANFKARFAEIAANPNLSGKLNTNTAKVINTW